MTHFLLSSAKKTVLLDTENVNYALYLAAHTHAKHLIKAQNPAMHMKAVKNETEQKNMRIAHLYDGVAMFRLHHFIKQHAGDASLTELDIAKKANALRREVGATDESFETIAGFAENGAIVHYAVTEESNKQITAPGLLLVDSGGQYPYGTTDVTRTYAIGSVSKEEKRAYTLVLTGMLRLAAARFPAGTTGENLDAIARTPLWQYGLDFRHGTGHGVGYRSAVHEGPNAIRKRGANTPFVPGMITSDEPGYYAEGQFGVRCENLLLCIRDRETAYGPFLRFSHLTFAPFDLDAIDTTLMSAKDIALLNAYHEKVFMALSPLLSDEERAVLAHYTRKIEA